MQLENKSILHPFQLMAFRGLGISRPAALEHHLPISPRTFGQAKLTSAVNLTIGNHCFIDRQHIFAALASPVTFGFVYNSLAKEQKWQLGYGRKLALASSNNELIVTEADGREVRYAYSEEQKHYIAEEAVDQAKPYVNYDADKKLWYWYHPAERKTNYFDAKGNLIESLDKYGNSTTYIYNHEYELIEIQAASHVRYEFRRTSNDIQVYLHDETGEHLLHHYYRDAQKNLIKSVTPDGYEINYAYDDEQNIQAVTQSDASRLAFEYENGKVKNIKIGEEDLENIYQFDRQDDTVSVIDAKGINVKFSIDQNGKIKRVDQERGVDNANGDVDTISCEHNLAGQVTGITFPDKSMAEWDYDDENGLLIRHIRRDGSMTEYQYTSGDKPLLSKKIDYPVNHKKGAPRVTQYIYDETFNSEFAFLRFEVSPEGHVKEYLPDDKGLVVKKREFPRDKLEVEDALFGTLNLSQLEQWSNNCVSRSILTDFSYDPRGRNTSFTQYNAVANTGNAIDDGKQAQEKYLHDWFDRVVEKHIRLSEGAYAKEKHAYDDLDRVTQSIAGYESNLAQTTRHEYIANIAKTIHPNGRIEQNEWNAQGILVKEHEEAVHQEILQTRIHQYQHDKNSALVQIELPDKRKIYPIYDRQHRLGYIVSQKGAVTKHEYLREVRCHIKTAYYNGVELSQLVKADENKASSERLEELLRPTPTQDQQEYTFYGLNEKVRYEIDAEGYLTEYQYDDFNYLAAKIIYGQKITPTELDALLNGGQITRTPDRNVDEVHNYFNNQEGVVIAEQDPAGYLVEYERDNVDSITKKIEYQYPIPLFSLNLNEIKSAGNLNKKLETYYFYNGKKECILDVDPKGYMHSYDYENDGKRKEKIRYDLKVDASWYADVTAKPVPIASAFDQKEAYEYDDIRRLVTVKKPYHAAETFTYDEMNNCLSHLTTDESEAGKVVGDFYRKKEDNYDGWQQVQASLNPFVTKALAEIDISDLPEDEKELKKQTLIQNSAEKCIYDESGLKVRSVNALGKTTLYFYDDERQPVYVVDPDGAVIGNTLNMLNQVSKERHFYNSISKMQLSLLSGGFLTADLTALFESLKSKKDREISYIRDRRGLVVEKYDAQNRLSTYQHDAFRRKRFEHLPVNGDQPELHIEHIYEPRGLEIETIRTANNKSIKRSQRYEHLHGKLTFTRDEIGDEAHFQYDELDRIERVLKKDEQGDLYVHEENTYDAFDRPLTHTDANQNQTRFEYQPDELKVTQLQPTGSIITVKTNIFNQIIEHLDGEGNLENMTHEPSGDLASHQLGDAQTVITHDVAGRKETTIDPIGSETAYEYTDADHVRRTIEDKGKLNLETLTYPNSFGENEKTVNPKGIATSHESDLDGNETVTLEDPDSDNYSGLNIRTETKHNALGSVTDIFKGSEDDRYQYVEKYTHDGFNRLLEKIIDPNGLNLVTTYAYDDANNLIRETDAEGFSKRYILNNLHLKRFELVEQSGEGIEGQFKVTEWTYTKTKKIRSQKVYQNGISIDAVTDQSDVNAVKAQAKASPYDTLHHFFYDQNDNARFTVKIIYDPVKQSYFAAIEEKLFDKANRAVKTINYVNSVSADEIDTWKTEDIEKLVAKIADPSHDQVTFHCHDEKDQEIYTIDQDGLIKETVYDLCGRLIGELEYGPLPEAELKKFPLKATDAESIVGACKQSVKATYYVRDNKGRELFVVHPDRSVQGKIYDKNSNIVSVCTYKDFAKPYASYEDLVEQLKLFVPTPGKDTIEATIYDRVDRVDTINDSFNRPERFKRDALGRLRFYTKRNGQVWEYQYDRANRLTHEISPETTIYVPKKLENGKLGYDKFRTRIAKKTDFDRVNNAVKITEGFGIDEVTNGQEMPRPFHSRFNTAKGLISTKVENVPVAVLDEEGQPTGEITIENIETQVLYNLKSKVVAKQNETGIWDYFVFDSAERLIFEITKGETLKKYTYDSLDRVINEYTYAEAVNVNHDLFSDPARVAQVVDVLSTHPVSNEDRETEYTYHRNGKVKSIRSKPVIYAHEGKIDIARPETLQEFDTFGNRIYEGKLIAKDVWAENFYCFDDSKHEIANINENNYLTEYERDTHGRVIKRIEYSEKIDKKISIGITLTDALAAVPDLSKKREYEYIFDAEGNSIGERQLHVQVSELSKDESGKPVIKRSTVDLEKQWEYTETGKPKSYLDENGNPENYYLDERDVKIAVTPVARTSEDANGNPIIITPLEVNLPNAYGQVINVLTSPKTAVTSDNGLPVFSDPNSVNETITLVDNRGLPIIEQDSEGNQTQYGFTPTKKQAFEEKEVSHWVKIDQPDIPDPHPHIPHAVQSDLSENDFVHIEKESIEDDWTNLDEISDENITNQDSNDATEPNNENNQGIANNNLKTKAPPIFVQEKHKERKIYKQDRFDNTIEEKIYRDNELEDSTYHHINHFNEPVGLGKNKSDFSEFYKTDTEGRSWFNNAEANAYAITLRNLKGDETLRFRAADIDLSQTSYDASEFQKLLNMDRASVELRLTYRNRGGQTEKIFDPIFFQTPNNEFPTFVFTKDRWGNDLETRNGRNELTRNVFDDRSLLIKKFSPNVTNINPDFTSSISSIEENYHFNKRGVLIGETDGENHLTGYFADEAGQMVEHVLPDGAVKEHIIIDAMNCPYSVRNEANFTTRFTFDSLKRTTSLIKPSGRTYFYSSDEKGNRTTMTDPAGGVYRYNHDARNNCTDRFLPLGQQTKMIYDRNGQHLLVINADNSQWSWVRNFFGMPISHIDYNNRNNMTTYNFLGKIKFFDAVGGYQRQHVYFNPFDNRLYYYNDSPGQHQEYQYEYGLLKYVIDTGLNHHYAYEYDMQSVQYKVTLTQLSSGRLIQEIVTHYDAIYRDSTTVNTQLVFPSVTPTFDLAPWESIDQYRVSQVCSGYDKANNYIYRQFLIRGVKRTNGVLEQPIIYDEWNTYDAASRLIINAGRLVNNQVVLGPQLGCKFVLAGGLRIREECLDSNGKSVHTDVTWDVDNQLTGTHSNSTFVTTQRTLNAIGGVTNFTQTYPAHEINVQQTINANGWTVASNTTEYENQKFKSSQAITYGMADIGLPITQVNQYKDSHNNITTDNLNIAYTGDTSFLLAGVGGTRTNHYGTSGISVADMWYDQNYNTNSKLHSIDEYDESLKNCSNDQLTYFERTYDGKYLRKQKLMWDLKNGSIVGSNNSYNFICNIQGQPLGVYQEAVWYANALMAYRYNMPLNAHLVPEENQKNDPTKGDYVSASLPMVPQIYPVEPGDTLESIAEKQYGDKNKAREIALENGLLVNAKLAAGHIIILPPLLPLHNKSDMARPYQDFVNLLSGKLLPQLDTPKPKTNHPSFLKTLIKVVAVAIVLMVAPYLAGTVLGLTGVSFIAASAAFAAIGDACVQGLAIKAGIQSKFSGTEVFETAVTAATGSALDTLDHAATLGERVLATAVAQVGSQLAEMAVGSRKQFDTRDIALQVAAVVAGAKISEAAGVQPGQGQYMREFSSNAATNLVNSALGSVVTHAPFSLQTAAANAIGSTVANPLAEKVISKIPTRQELAARPKPAEPKTNPAPTQDKNLSKELAKAQEAAKVKGQEGKSEQEWTPKLDPLAAKAIKDRLARWRSEDAILQRQKLKAFSFITETSPPGHYKGDFYDALFEAVSEKSYAAGLLLDVLAIKDTHIVKYGSGSEKLKAEVSLGLSCGGPILKGIKLAKDLSPLVSRMGMWAGNLGRLPDFASEDLLISHFIDHGSEFKGAYKSASEYLKGAHDVIKKGIKVAYEYKGEIRAGYVKFMGNNSKGIAKFELVGTNNEGQITTYHVESGKSFWKLLNGDPNNKTIIPYKFSDLITKNHFKF